jgi:hypothetical protein
MIEKDFVCTRDDCEKCAEENKFPHQVCCKYVCREMNFCFDCKQNPYNTLEEKDNLKN